MAPRMLPQRSANLQFGFTLVEAVVTIMILIILTVIFLPHYSSIPNVNLQAQQLANDIRFAQAYAMAHNSRYRINLLIPPNQYSFSDTSNNPVNLPATNTSTVTFTTGISYGTITNLPNGVITFNGVGAPYADASGTTTPIAGTAIIQLTSGAQTKSVQITPETGMVVVQ